MKIELVEIDVSDAKRLWKMQKEAFLDLYKKYKDKKTSPTKEPLRKVIERLKQPFSYYYYIKVNDDLVGAIRVVDKGPSEPKRISPIFILPPFQNKGIAKMAILEVEKLHGSSNWELSTILEEKKNCYLYEKMGYKRTGEMQIINEKMTLVFYKK